MPYCSPTLPTIGVSPDRLGSQHNPARRQPSRLSGSAGRVRVRPAVEAWGTVEAMPSRPGLRALLVALGTAFAMAATPVAMPLQPASAQDTGRVVPVNGHGWGHGRGLGQWGANGYARDAGWTSGQILDHYYGGTTSGPAPAGGTVDPQAVRVELRFMVGQATTVALGQGTIVLRGTDDAELARLSSGAARLRWNGSGYDLDTAPACAGPWTVQSTIAGRTTVRLVAESTGTNSNRLLQACGPAYRSWYEGELWAVVEAGATRTINLVPVEQYLRGVVPNEMPSGWPSAALEAQAVAARSYALAGDSRQAPYADTCDSTLCQVYDGVYTSRGGAFRSSTAARTDAAIAATAGTVRLRGNATVARTEFSSSTGGWTAGGEFPAVVDDGDATATNPHHAWSVSVDLTPLEATYNRGHIEAITVVQRNGLGADGGRATRVELRFEQGTVTETGSTVRSLLGLKSDWFTPGAVVDTSKRRSPEGAYIDRSYQRLVGRPASEEELDRWYATIQRGDRLALTTLLVHSDHFLGRVVDDLYQRALGRDPDPDGKAYWIAQINGGLTVEQLGVLFFGSREFFLRTGGTDASFVTALYRAILGRDPDPGGQQYWEGQLGQGGAGLDDVAAGFYQSLESRRDRAVVLHLETRGEAPSEPARAILAERLLSADDLVVAAEIAASPEA
jgi:SpoIID/LytB domain protein